VGQRLRQRLAAPAVYDAAQAELAGHFRITTFKLPKLPRDTVVETRKRLVIEELEAALDNVDSSICAGGGGEERLCREYGARNVLSSPVDTRHSGLDTGAYRCGRVD
jgi:hypothetical protein